MQLPWTLTGLNPARTAQVVAGLATGTHFWSWGAPETVGQVENWLLCVRELAAVALIGQGRGRGGRHLAALVQGYVLCGEAVHPLLR